MPVGFDKGVLLYPRMSSPNVRMGASVYANLGEWCMDGEPEPLPFYHKPLAGRQFQYTEPT
jgi:hypothetical protein